MSVGERYAIRAIAGEEVKFHKLTPYDRAEILRTLKKQRRAEMLEDLKTAGASPDQTYGELRQFDAKPYGHGEFLDYVDTSEGRLDVLKMALRASLNGSTEEKLRQFTPTMQEELELVAELCGIQLRATENSGDSAEAYGERSESSDPPMGGMAEDTYQTPKMK